MAIALVTTSKDLSRRRKSLRITGTVSGNYVTGGITVDWTTVTNPKVIGNGLVAAQPTTADVVNCPAGYTAILIPGATLKLWKLKVSTTADAELAAAAFPAGIIAVPFVFNLSGPLGNF